MTTLIIISLIINTLYLACTIKAFGIPWSISDTFYLLEIRKKGYGMFFTAWAWLAAFPLMIAWIDLSEGHWYQAMAFLACGSLMFVGAAAQFKQSLTNAVHYGAAGLCVASAVTWVILSGYWYIPAITFAICAVVAAKDRKWVFWFEIAAFAATYLTLLIV